jgi:hypothetical protein
LSSRIGRNVHRALATVAVDTLKLAQRLEVAGLPLKFGLGAVGRQRPAILGGVAARLRLIGH